MSEPQLDRDLDRILSLEQSGELLAAYDQARRALARHPGDRRLQHRAVLILARAGALAEAAYWFKAWRLDQSDEQEDAALGARLIKDQAFAAGDAREGRALAAQAASAYEALYQHSGDHYPGINAATLWLLSGEPSRAGTLARQLIALFEETGEGLQERGYFSLATEAEAWLLLGQDSKARECLNAAVRACPDDLAAHASTHRQLRRVLRVLGRPEDLLEALQAPTVAHYAGHLIGPDEAAARFPAFQEERVRMMVRQRLREEGIRYGFGSLAAGADIIIAEEILDQGGDIHVLLPFREDEFLARSVRPAGPLWVERYQACRARARAVSFATREAFLDDPVLFGYCSEYAMGLACLRARHLDAPLVQLTVWDGETGSDDAVAGTGHDVRVWSQMGARQNILNPGGGQPPGGGTHAAGLRVRRALLFADIKGYGGLDDQQILAFRESVLAPLADVVNAYQDQIESSETWGDALYSVFYSVEAAAACALDLQATVAEIDMPTRGLPDELQLRVGLHYGPVFPARDPILNRATSVGAQVTLAARIEPVAIPGSVYASEPFAARLELSGETGLSADYLGTTEAAKAYGAMAMYRIRSHKARPLPR